MFPLTRPLLVLIGLKPRSCGRYLRQLAVEGTGQVHREGCIFMVLFAVRRLAPERSSIVTDGRRVIWTATGVTSVALAYLLTTRSGSKNVNKDIPARNRISWASCSSLLSARLPGWSQVYFDESLGRIHEKCVGAPQAGDKSCFFGNSCDIIFRGRQGGFFPDKNKLRFSFYGFESEWSIYFLFHY